MELIYLNVFCRHATDDQIPPQFPESTVPQPDHIVKIALPERHALDEDIQKYLDICVEKLGFEPYVLLAYTARQEKFRTFTKFYNQLMLDVETCTLTKLEREMIAVVVSSANRCFYCLVAHGNAVRQLSGDPQLGEMMALNYRIADLPERQRAMLDYAWKLTKTPHDIGDDDRQALRAVGFSDAELFDITDVCAFFNYTNRVAHGLDMMPNPEYHAMDR